MSVCRDVHYAESSRINPLVTSLHEALRSLFNFREEKNFRNRFKRIRKNREMKSFRCYVIRRVQEKKKSVERTFTVLLDGEEKQKCFLSHVSQPNFKNQFRLVIEKCFLRLCPQNKNSNN